ncbi:MAG: TIGR00159 family protein [Chloroflexi bacterium]|nr:TIGR00159 family protein [Chloroflexota bacterium]
MPELPWIFWRFDFTSLADILIVALVFYWAITIVQGTRATQLIWGVVILLIIAAILSTRREFSSLNFLIDRSIPFLILSIPIIFAPELRRALEQVGHTGSLLNRPFGGAFGPTHETSVVDEICRAAAQLARQRYGALIVVERDTGLGEFIDRAVSIDSAVSRQLLITIFFPNTPLHDGAVIIRHDRVAAAAAVLPLTEQEIGGNLGTRHRAAVGVTEVSDALAIVVSEETGQISLATDGRLRRNLTQERLRHLMLSLLRLEMGAPDRLPDGPVGLPNP